MTGSPSETYTPAWFKARERYRPVYHAFADAIEEVFHPTSLADIGCGAGYLLEHFMGTTVPFAGVDGSRAAHEAQSQDVSARTLIADLSEPPPEGVWPRVDLAVSIEVAEHIPAEHEAAFLSWFAGAQRVLFTAALPGQRGTDHVNCQPRDYWIARFEALGFTFAPADTVAWQTEARSRTRGCPWVVRNAMVFVASAHPSGRDKPRRRAPDTGARGG
jgi:hypothetical protein